MSPFCCTLTSAAATSSTSRSVPVMLQPIVTCREQHVRQHRHGLPALDHTDDTLQGIEQIFARGGQFHGDMTSL